MALFAFRGAVCVCVYFVFCFNFLGVLIVGVGSASSVSWSDQLDFCKEGLLPRQQCVVLIHPGLVEDAMREFTLGIGI